MAEDNSGCYQDLAGQMAASSGEDIPVKGAEELKKSLSRQMALLALMNKTGYDILQANGQRKYGGPPPEWEGPAPRIECEVFVGNIPRDMYEDELVPLVGRAGTIYELRLMMEFSGENRGYAFVMYTKKEEALLAIQMLNHHEVRPGKFIGVCASLNNCRLFLGNIPKDKSKEEISEEVKKVTEGLQEVTVYPSATGKNRGFAFLQYETHKEAALARRELISRMRLWGQNHMVNWAKPKHGKRATMQQVKVSQVGNLSENPTEETLQRELEHVGAGAVGRVKKFTNHALSHFGHQMDATGLMNRTTAHGNIGDIKLFKTNLEAVGRRSGSKSHFGSMTEGGATPLRGIMNERSSLDSTIQSPSSQWNSKFSSGPVKANQDVFPLFPGTPLYHTCLQQLQRDQITSAVSLLELYCGLHNLPSPHYKLLSSPDQDGNLLLVYEVVMMLTRTSFLPDTFCVQLEDAKELAARHTLQNLDASFLIDLPGSPSFIRSADLIR
ncbi:probable RNA-binding protein 46 isoform X1 [Corythoichthys intestinalis]|uniref:probable RNA-binding protein 46 isoform X1 n=1 Tax=Corythoichthys intestinalis TaxID=161448 RepID=UPI0025A53DD2|nr:probable RNA-binding protein 46 isoform X1 [Corythoichthys intestinalis]